MTATLKCLRLMSRDSEELEQRITDALQDGFRLVAVTLIGALFIAWLTNDSGAAE